MEKWLTRKTLTWIFVLFGLGYLAAHLVIITRPPEVFMNWYLTDDAFYYFQIARNVVQGKGFSFDGIGLSNGFHPLWLFLILPVFALSVSEIFLPLKIIILISAMLTYCAGLILYLILRNDLGIRPALLGFLIWILYWPIQRIVTMGGLETGINALMILLFIWTLQKMDPEKHYQLAFLGVLGAFVVFGRLDNIFLVLLAGAWMVFTQKSMRYFVTIDILLVFISVFLSVMLRTGVRESLAFLPATQVFLVVSLPVKLIIFYLFKLYDPIGTHSPEKLALRLAGAGLVSAGLVSGIMLGLAWADWLPSGFPRLALILDAFLVLLLIGLTRFLFFIFRKKTLPPETQNRDNWRRIILRASLFLIPLMLFVGLYAFWNMRAFATPLPVSGQVKMWWGTLPNPPYESHRTSVLDIFYYWRPNEFKLRPWFLVYDLIHAPIIALTSSEPDLQGRLWFFLTILAPTIILGVGIFFVLRKERLHFEEIIRRFSLLPLLAACLIYPFYLACVGYQHAREWYWVPQIIFTVIFFCYLFSVLINKLTQYQKSDRIVFIVLSLVGVLLFSEYLGKISKNFPKTPPDYAWDDFFGSTAYLEVYTEPGSLIGITGGGYEAYFIEERTIVNLDGLINSKVYFDLMKSGEAAQYFDKIGLDYVFGRPGMLLGSDPYWWFFGDRLEPIDDTLSFVLFRYLPEP